MDSTPHDAIIIGAGGMGTAAAYHLARQGKRTLLLEQFTRGHSFGSSHGHSRIIRYFYDKPYYTELMRHAYPEWRRVEEASGRRLLHIVGGITFGRKGDSYIENVRLNLESYGIESEWWEPEELRRRFPQFRADADTGILWQKDTGFLHASQCVLTCLELAERHGAEVREETRVTEVRWEKDLPEVVAGGECYRARVVVVTAGPWLGQLFRELGLPLKVTRQQIVYYQPKNERDYYSDRFPIFTDRAGEEFFYGFPVFACPGVKVARHGGGQEVTPETCDRTPDEDYIEHLRDYLRRRLPDVAGDALSAQVCLYTETPDDDFVIDRHPNCPNVLIAGGFSGHGFKFCALVGRILAELTVSGQTSFNIQPFRIARF